MGSKDINGETYSTIILPNVLSFAQDFYGCSSLDGVPLEQEGSVGTSLSHWDKAFLPNEFMNPTIESPGIMSDFTFELLKGSGWYQVNINCHSLTLTFLG